MIKKIVSLLLAVVMMLLTFTGCGTKQTDVSGETVTLKVGIPQNSNVSDYENNALTRYLEESLNIKIKFSFFSSTGSEYTQQLALMCASNEELPDVLLGFRELGQYVIKQYGQDGYFQDLTDLIEKYGKNYNEQLSKLDKEMQTLIKERGTDLETGGFYGMPVTGVSLPDDMQNMMYINETWLKAVGKEIPTTIDELYDVLKAFKEQDPNGNGQADEIPMISRAAYQGGIENYIVNAFVYYDGANPYNATNGKVWSSYTSDEYRQALIYLNKLCSEGLFSDMCLTTTSTEVKTLITPSDDIPQVGVWCGHPSLMTNAKTKILDQYVALPSLKGATDLGGYTVVSPSTPIYNAFITKDCENPEAAMKLLDFFYNDETVARVRHGEKGVDWEESEGTSDIGTKSYIKVINDNAFFSGNSTWCTTFNYFATETNFMAIAVEGEGRAAEVSRLLSETYGILKEAKQPTELVHSLVYTDEEYQIREELSGTHSAYVHEQRGLFITGEINPNSDADWNEYLATLEKIGESKLLGVAQSAYARQTK